jgi:hypothetical protein
MTSYTRAVVVRTTGRQGSDDSPSQPHAQPHRSLPRSAEQFGMVPALALQRNTVWPTGQPARLRPAANHAARRGAARRGKGSLT